MRSWWLSRRVGPEWNIKTCTYAGVPSLTPSALLLFCPLYILQGGRLLLRPAASMALRRTAGRLQRAARCRRPLRPRLGHSHSARRPLQAPAESHRYSHGDKWGWLDGESVALLVRADLVELPCGLRRPWEVCTYTLVV